MPTVMITFILFTLFLSSVAGVMTEGEKLDLPGLLRRISDLEERLHVQEKINEEQDTIIKTLLLEKTERTFAPETKIATLIENEQNGNSHWPNGDLENKTIPREGVPGINTEINLHTSLTVKSAVKDLKQISPENATKKDKRAIVAGDVAFYSYLSNSEKDPGHHHTIIFDNIVTNVGGYYNHHSGIFTSQENGVYTFSWTLYCSIGGYFTTELVVNSNAVGAAFCNTQGADNIRQTSGVVVVAINFGDIVYVRTSPTDQIHGYIFSNANARTSFSGWKLI